MSYEAGFPILQVPSYYLRKGGPLLVLPRNLLQGSGAQTWPQSGQLSQLSHTGDHKSHLGMVTHQPSKRRSGANH